MNVNMVTDGHLRSGTKAMLSEASKTRQQFDPIIVRSIISIFFMSVIFIVSACSKSDPGPLGGTWQVNGGVPMTVQFRPGETETMGVIEKVSYEITGNQILMRYESGPMEGTAVRFMVTGPNEVQSQIGILRRING